MQRFAKKFFTCAWKIVIHFVESRFVFILAVNVFIQSITPKNFLSMQFLANLIKNGCGYFQFDENSNLISTVSVNDAKPTQQVIDSQHTEEQLVVFAESLNLEKLLKVKQLLEPQVSILSFYAKLAPDSQTAFAIKVNIQINNEEQLQARLEAIALACQVELAITKAAPKLSQPGLLLMDMDSTVIDVECIDEIAKLAGVGDKVSEVTELAMQGKLDFAESLINRVNCLANANEDILLEVRDRLPLMPGLSKLVSVLKANHWKVAIASGGFTYFADYLADRLELDAAVANQLNIADGKLLGTVSGAIVDANVKAETLLKLADKWGIPHSQTVAMGDGANDLVMMNAAGLGVAYHAKPIVRQQAAAAIRFGGLDILLWMLES